MTAKELLKDHLYPEIKNILGNKYYVQYSPKENWIHIGDLTEEEKAKLKHRLEKKPNIPEEQVIFDALKSSELPNTYIGGVDEGDNIRIHLGISFDNINSMRTFEELSSKLNRDARTVLVGNIAGVDKHWTFCVNKKTKLDTPFSSPNYDVTYSFRAYEMDDERLTLILQEIVRVRKNCLSYKRVLGASPKILVEGKKRNLIFQGPTVNTMAHTFIYTDKSEYARHRDDALSVLDALLSMRTHNQIQTANKDAFDRVSEAILRVINAHKVVPKLRPKYEDCLKALLCTISLSDSEWEKLRENYGGYAFIAPFLKGD